MPISFHARRVTREELYKMVERWRDWVEWATARAEALNPFDGGAVGMLETIAEVKQWS
jgi:hypothetical protein